MGSCRDLDLELLEFTHERRSVGQAAGDLEPPALHHHLQGGDQLLLRHMVGTFGVWRDGQHDDLVLALALACWWSERVPPFEAPTVIPTPPRQGLLERMVSGRSLAQQRGLFGLRG